MNKREIYWRTLFGLEDPLVQVHSLLIGLCSCCNPQPGILRGILISSKSYQHSNHSWLKTSCHLHV